MKKVEAFKCEFCNKVLESSAKMEKHESTCIKRKANTQCDSCSPLDKMACAIDGIKSCKL